MLNETQEPGRKLIDIKWVLIFNILFRFLKGQFMPHYALSVQKQGIEEWKPQPILIMYLY